MHIYSYIFKTFVFYVYVFVRFKWILISLINLIIQLIRTKGKPKKFGENKFFKFDENEIQIITICHWKSSKLLRYKFCSPLPRM